VCLGHDNGEGNTQPGQLRVDGTRGQCRLVKHVKRVPANIAGDLTQADRWKPLGQRQKSIIPQSSGAYLRHSISAAAIIAARSGRTGGARGSNGTNQGAV
jgi:hypothetical protein